MNTSNIGSIARCKGYSLIELIIATCLSLLVSASMIVLMSNSLADTTRIIKMTKLTDELRSSLQMMSRDVRRSNYSADAIHCFANPDCTADGSLSSPGDVVISENSECFIFMLDRDHDGDATENAAGGFRRATPGGIGVLEMWVGDNAPDCQATDTNWRAVTDPNDIEVTSFLVDDDLSYTEVIWDDGDGNQTFQKVRKVRMSITGHLTSDSGIQRTIEDVIKLRNNLYL